MEKIDQILSALDSIKQSQEQTNETVNKIAIRQKRVETKLLGDKEFKTLGLIDELDEIKLEQKNIKTEHTNFKETIHKKEVSEKINRAKKTGIIFGASVGGGAGGYGLIEWLKSVFS